MLWALGLLAPISLVASDLPRLLAWPLALFALARAAFAARRYRALPARVLTIPSAGAAVCDGRRIDRLQVGWRGPLAFLRWRDGSGAMQGLSFWPDTLDAGMRRELRIAMQRREAASAGPSVAG